MKIRVTTLAGFGCIILAASYIFAMVQGGFLPWFIFYFAATLLSYEIATVIFGVRNTTTTRVLSAKRLTAGQMLDVTIEVNRESVWPLFWLRVTDELPQRWVFQTQGAEQVLQPLCRKRMTFQYSVVGLQRGLYHVGNTRIETGDLLGIIERSKLDNRRDEVLVYPRVVPVRGWISSHSEELGFRQPTRRRTNESTNVIGVRDYVPGDRLNRIHWPASARKGMLQAKEFELHVSSELMFIPDLAKSSFQSQAPSLFELEMTIVASLMKQTYEFRRMFGAIMHGAKLTQFPVGTDEALFLRCMSTLAVANPDGYTGFADTLARISQEVSLGTTLVVVSPRLDREVAVGAEIARRRSQVEWFVPVDSPELTDAQKHGLAMLEAARVNVYLIGSQDQLANLKRGGGVQRATGEY